MNNNSSDTEQAPPGDYSEMRAVMRSVVERLNAPQSLSYDERMRLRSEHRAMLDAFAAISQGR